MDVYLMQYLKHPDTGEELKKEDKVIKCFREEVY